MSLRGAFFSEAVSYFEKEIASPQKTRLTMISDFRVSFFARTGLSY